MASAPRTHSDGDNIVEMEQVAANGVPNVVPTNRDNNRLAEEVPTNRDNNRLAEEVPTNCDNNRLAEKRKEAYRSWLLLLTSLAATVTFTVGLTPPGGFWAADDNTNGYVAGISVMRDKFPVRFLVFYYSNTTAFFTSLMIIATLSKSNNTRNTNSEQPNVMGKHVLNSLVVLCFLSLGTSYVAGTWDSPSRVIYVVAVFVVNIVYMLLPKCFCLGI